MIPAFGKLQPRLILLMLFLFVSGLSAKSNVQLPDSVCGAWTGTGSLYQPLARQIAPSPLAEDNPSIELTIQSDGKVTGQIGGAKLVDCRARRSRRWFGRLLNIRTDFIIKGGFLEGPLCPADTMGQKNFTMPFNVTNHRIKGTVMQIHKWKYPDPLVRVKISRKSSAN